MSNDTDIAEAQALLKWHRDGAEFARERGDTATAKFHDNAAAVLEALASRQTDAPEAGEEMVCGLCERTMIDGVCDLCEGSNPAPEAGLVDFDAIVEASLASVVNYNVRPSDLARGVAESVANRIKGSLTALSRNHRDAVLEEVKSRLDQAYGNEPGYFRARINSLRSYVDAALKEPKP